MYYGAVYKITNTLTGKSYIGQTIKPKVWDRVKIHFNKSTDFSYIGRAINKYGRDNFTWEVIACCSCLEDLNYIERLLIQQNDCLVPNGYNLDTGGKSKGKVHKQTKLKIRLKQKFKSKSNSGNSKKWNKEMRKKASEKRKGFDTRSRQRARKANVYKRKIKGDFVSVTAINIQTGKEYTYSTIAECCKELKLDATCVSRVCRSKDGRTQHKGYKFTTQKFGQSISPTKRPLKYIRKINKGGYSVVIKRKYIGYRKELEEAILLRDKTLNSKEN
jgi:group I intron endonuclease